MIIITGYQIIQLLYESANTVVLRGYKEENNQPVILKLLKSEYAHPIELTRYKREYEISLTLNLEGVVKAYDLQKYENTLLIVLEDFGGESLESLLAKRKFSLKEFLSIAIQITDSLAKIHAAKIIHKDINPANIVFNPATKQCKIIDFGISTVFSQENPTLQNPQVLSGTLAYMSPEQTGRMNRCLDYRTDFYSLGVTFYQLLTQHLPFQANNPLELVHCHLAKQPIKLHSLGYPKAISDIVIKLMGKTAEERYQSAWGILADLSACLQQLQTTGKITELPLGCHDLSNNFQIPQKLYGREKEVNTLLNAFERVSQGATEMMLVSGYSGVGKSSLVQEIYKPVTRQKGYFISGKFDQFQRDVPYSAIVSAFSELVQMLLTESKSQLEFWKEKLLAAFGINGQVIIDVIPEVELIVGKQPTSAALEPAESQNRFHLVFQNFIKVFCSSKHPLVIFLDDLQWVDSATLKLLELIMTDNQIQYLFAIAAYRDNEVSPTHPLMMKLDNLRSFAKINEIILSPLNLEHIQTLIAETVQRNTTDVKPLAELVVRKTDGNPFFVNQFLKTLQQENLLVFHSTLIRWEWDIEMIEKMDITDNVVELMVVKLKKLPLKTQSILKIAACVGNRFSLNTLAIVSNQSLAIAFQELLPVIQEGLVLPLSELQLDRGEILDSQLVILDFKFLHDRVQQAAYALIDERDKKQLHWNIGQLILQNCTEKEIESNIFDIVNHLNLGVETLSDRQNQLELAELNLRAGKKAKASTAYHAAKQYFSLGTSYLSVQEWSTAYELMFNLHKNLASCSYLTGNFTEAERLFNLILAQADSVFDQAEIYTLKMNCHMIKGEFEQGIKVGYEALKKLEVILPENEAELQLAVQIEMQKVQTHIQGKNIADFVDAIALTDRKQQICLDLLADMFALAYMDARDYLLNLSSLKIVNISLENGNTNNSSFGYITYGMILGMQYEYHAAYEFGDLALKLNQKYNNRKVVGKIYNLFCHYINPYRHHYRTNLPIFQNSYAACIKNGDLLYGAWALYFIIYTKFIIGNNLYNLTEESHSILASLKKTKDQNMIYSLQVLQHVMRDLQGNTGHQFILDDSDESEEKALLFWRNNNFQSFINWYSFLKIQLFYINGECNEAIKIAQDSEKYIIYNFGIYPITEYYFYYSLILTELYPHATTSKKQEYWLTLEKNQEKMKIWATNCPENFLHKYLLIAAEMDRVSGKLSAIELYDRAIASAQENGFVQNEALASELAGKFWLSLGKKELAQGYLKRAYQCYQIWGAQIKVNDLEKKYSHLLAISNTTTTSDRSYTNSNLLSLDVDSILKAYQAISSEIVLDKLLIKLMEIIVENAGAQAGYFLLVEENQLLIAASISVNDKQVELSVSIPADVSQALPWSVINYVERTCSDVVLNNAAVEGMFATDPYIASQYVKSVLCTPILNQGKLIGLLYLENNLIDGAFTPKRVEILKLLAAQAAISLDHALLYTSVEKKVEARTQELNEKNQYLQETLFQLQRTQSQLVQNAKMSSLGQLVAGVAHEINNPISFIYSNIVPAGDYIQGLLRLIDLYQQYYPQPTLEIQKETEDIDLDFIASDLPKLLTSMKIGAERIKKIVLSLRNFSRMDEAELKSVNIHEGIDNTLMILEHRLKRQTRHPQIEVIKEYGQLPLVSCYPGLLNQVFMNILVNAIDAIEDKGSDISPPVKPTIRISTKLCDRKNVLISIADSGGGIPYHLQDRLFDPFFTTKPVGQGTGMGLSISYQIVTEKHRGNLKCISKPGEGAEFTIEIPLFLTAHLCRGS